MVSDSYTDTMSTTYDYRFGKPLTVTDPTGSTMTYSYDFAGRLVSVTSPLNTSGTPSLVNEYHPVNYYRNGFSPQGFSYNESPTHHPYAVSLHYDDNGNLITATAVLTNGFGQAIQTKKGLRAGNTNMMQVSGRTVVDAFGRTVEQYDPVVEPCTSHWGQYNTGYSAASLTTIAYDVLDRATSTVQPLGITTTTAYSIDDDRRFVTAVTDPNGNVTTQYADYEGRRVKVSDAAGGTTQFAYDALGQLISSTDPEEFSTHYIYDNLGRMTQRDHPDAGVTLYTYDPAGNLLTETNPLGPKFQLQVQH
jgi:YD repeat-containing protein